LAVVEDAAHASGACYRGWPIGAGNPDRGFSSDAVAFSFYATKNMTTGEGGMVTTHRKDLADTMRILCLHGISKDAWNRYGDRGNWHYEVLEPGFKYNLSDIMSSIGIHQLRRLEGFHVARTRYAALYKELLSDVSQLEMPPDRADCRHAWHLYSLRLNLEQIEGGREAFITGLHEEGVGTSVHFIPIPLHPFFKRYLDARNYCPRALALYPRLVSMPLYPTMTEEQVVYAAKATKRVVERLGTRITFPGADLEALGTFEGERL
jgi:dTDP-4-amino-4,6-dideoxygalactose transaminase